MQPHKSFVVNILGNSWTVSISNDMMSKEIEGYQIQGECNLRKYHITVSPESPLQLVWFHEWTHAVLGTAGIPLSPEIEEVLATLISQALVQLFNQRAELPAWIFKETLNATPKNLATRRSRKRDPKLPGNTPVPGSTPADPNHADTTPADAGAETEGDGGGGC